MYGIPVSKTAYAVEVELANLLANCPSKFLYVLRFNYIEGRSTMHYVWHATKETTFWCPHLGNSHPMILKFILLYGGALQYFLLLQVQYRKATGSLVIFSWRYVLLLKG